MGNGSAGVLSQLSQASQPLLSLDFARDNGPRQSSQLSHLGSLSRRCLPSDRVDALAGARLPLVEAHFDPNRGQGGRQAAQVPT